MPPTLFMGKQTQKTGGFSWPGSGQCGGVLIPFLFVYFSLALHSNCLHDQVVSKTLCFYFKNIMRHWFGTP